MRFVITIPDIIGFIFLCILLVAIAIIYIDGALARYRHRKDKK